MRNPRFQTAARGVSSGLWRYRAARTPALLPSKVRVSRPPPPLPLLGHFRTQRSRGTPHGTEPPADSTSRPTTGPAAREARLPTSGVCSSPLRRVTAIGRGRLLPGRPGVPQTQALSPPWSLLTLYSNQIVVRTSPNAEAGAAQSHHRPPGVSAIRSSLEDRPPAGVRGFRMQLLIHRTT